MRPLKGHDHDVERIWTRDSEHCRYAREECVDPACRWWRVLTVPRSEQSAVDEWGETDE